VKRPKPRTTKSSAIAERPHDAPCCWNIAVTQGHSRSLEISPLSRSIMSSYWRSIVRNYGPRPITSEIRWDILIENRDFFIHHRCVQFSVLFSSLWSSMMRGRLCGKLHGGRSQLLFALHQLSIDSQTAIRRESPFFAYVHLHSILRLECPRRNIAIRFSEQILKWFGYPMMKKSLRIRLLVLIEFTNVAYGQTDTAWWRHSFSVFLLFTVYMCVLMCNFVCNFV